MGGKPSYRAFFNATTVGDILWFYVTRPIGGIVGLGRMKDRYKDYETLIWAEEKRKNRVIWPFRFRIQVLKLLPRSSWGSNRIRINDFNLCWQRGFQLLTNEHIQLLQQRASSQFGIQTDEYIWSRTTIIQTNLVAEPKLEFPHQKSLEQNISHKSLQNYIATIGKLQYYYTEEEYSIGLQTEKKNIDVVWKREMSGVPTYAFEVELSGSFEKAIERLKYAFKKWNSQPRIIVPQNKIDKVKNILSNSENNFSKQVGIYHPTQIENLLNKKLEFKKLEEELKLY